MPGIAGIICGQPHAGAEADLDAMVEAMRHEEFYRGGKYINRDVGLYVGWMGQRGSFADCMPLVGREGDVVLIFQGENYLDSDTLAQLRRGSDRIDDCKANYLLNLYYETGDNFLCKLNGWYCGLLVDLKTRKMTLFNDRYGMSRIYFHEEENGFLFASEAKSLLRVRRNLRALDPEGVAQLLRFNCVTGTKTLFSGISLLPTGASWVFENGARPKKKRYFNPSDWEQQSSLSAKDFYQKFSDMVTEVFPRYIKGRQTIAIALTAGLDSRLIVAALPNYNGTLSCCTYGGTWGETFDIGRARRIAALKKHPFDVIRIDQRFFDNFGHFAQRNIYISDGTHDAFGAHDVYLNQIARGIAKVRLTGKFGSEVVRNRKLVPWCTYENSFIAPEFRPVLNQLEPSDWLRRSHSLSRAVFDEIPRCEFGRVAVEQSQVILRTPYMDNDLVRLMYEAPEGIRAAGQVQGRYIQEHSPELGAIQTNFGAMGNSSQLLIKLRYAFYWSVFKTEYIYLHATPHWLTRIDRCFEKFRPERFLAGRRKFEGYRIWIKTNLSEFVQQTLLDPNAEYGCFFDKKSVEKMVTRHIAGTHNYQHEINKALTVELIYSSLIRQQIS
jgi:asparagine synthase (glutamine-hydrolysing)